MSKMYQGTTIVTWRVIKTLVGDEPSHGETLKTLVDPNDPWFPLFLKQGGGWVKLPQTFSY